jgi:acyl transferase domain-containing protein
MFITGYSGRFPDADSIPELYSKLLHKQDLVSSSKRYPQG